MTVSERLPHGLVGGLALLLIAAIFSSDRRAIRPRIVLTCLVLQIGIGAVALFAPSGRALLAGLAGGVDRLLVHGQSGIDFLFGGLGHAPGDGFVFAIRVLPQIVFISALIEILFHLGIMQRVASALGAALAVVTGCARINGFAAIITIFLGQSELPIAIRPAVPRLSRAELLTVMASGTASVAGSVLAGYAALGVRMQDLLAASFMAIPGGLLFASLLMPERAPSGARAPLADDGETARLANVFEAIAVGTGRGVKIAVMVGAMLLAFIGLISLLDGVLSSLGSLAGLGAWTLERGFGAVFAPLAWLIGVPWHDARPVGALIGQKLVFNEFVGYVHLREMTMGHVLADRRTISIASFALCGFANFSSIAILLAGFGSVAEARRAEIARLALRAVLAGTLSNLMSADIAGVFLYG